MSETVNSPAHYTSGSIECIDAIDDAVAGLTGLEGYYIGNIMKYIWRWKKKNGVEDLRKAQRYLTRLINLLEGGKGWGKCTNVQLDWVHGLDHILPGWRFCPMCGREVHLKEESD